MTRDCLLIVSSLFGVLVLFSSCRDNPRNTEIKSDKMSKDHKIARQSKEIVAQNVLAAQLARHNEIETKTTFKANEMIWASIYLTNPQHIEPRRISAFLVNGESVVEEQSLDVGASEQQQEFDFGFTKTPRPSGSYQIRFVEIKRSNGKPVLLARLFLNVE